MLYQAEGYLETEIWCEIPELRQYRVKDFWNWHRNFELFRSKFQGDFEHFEHRLRSALLLEREQFLGAYYERFEGGIEGDLVLG